VIKQLFLAREQKNSGKKFFLFIRHKVLFYETPFLHPARRNYVCGAIRKQSEEVSSSGGSSLEFWDKRRYNIVRTREVDYMCISPLQRKTSELEVE
jgi:hypothetical protein